MNNLEVLFLVSQLRYQDYLKEAEQERLGKLFLKSHPANRNIGTKINAWVQRILPYAPMRIRPLIQETDIPIPCCPAAGS